MNCEKLIWQEDFSLGVINRDVWTFEKGYVRNRELQSYEDSAENAFIRNGQLVIRAMKTEMPEKPYTSASLTTKDSRHFLYGRLEMRAKLPFGQGIWPAFWTLGTNIAQVGWPKCGEIDIFEMIGGNKVFSNGDSKICVNIHAADLITKREVGICELRNGKFSDNFHIFGINWKEECIEFYVDDVIFSRWNTVNIPELHWEHYIIVNIAVGGNWPGPPDETTVFPQEYVIDWIRYYKSQY